MRLAEYNGDTCAREVASSAQCNPSGIEPPSVAESLSRLKPFTRFHRPIYSSLLACPIMMFFFFVALTLALTLSEAATFPSMTTFSRRSNTEKSRSLAAVLPGDPIITGGLAMGAASAVSLYSKVILARYGG